LGDHPATIGCGRAGHREHRHGVAALIEAQGGRGQHLADDPQRHPDRGERVVDQDLSAGAEEGRPLQVVGEGPHIVLTVDVQHVQGLVPVWPQRGAVIRAQLDDVGHAGAGDVLLEPGPGRRAAE
jgi:hypothetical protein